VIAGRPASALYRPQGPLPPFLDCNMGGPRSRTRTQGIRSRLLGRPDGHLRCPSLLRLGLDFRNADPLQSVERLLAESGFRHREAAQEALLPDLPRRLCVQTPGIVPLQAFRADPREVLRQALMLGHCTAWLYDPARPLIWTRASLLRRVEIFNEEGFYA